MHIPLFIVLTGKVKGFANAKQPPPPRPDSPDPPSSSNNPQPARQPNPDDPFPAPRGGGDRERVRRAAGAAASARTNQYFVPKDGIDREVITADICRYLGNDALVRPGNYEHQTGYFITAYRNLTTSMISDLKADSERWESEKRATVSRGQPSNVGYRDSTTHQSRQYYGPTESQAGATPGYAAGPQVAYNEGASYSQQPRQVYYGQPSVPSYGQQTGFDSASSNYYVVDNTHNTQDSYDSQSYYQDSRPDAQSTAASFPDAISGREREKEPDVLG